MAFTLSSSDPTTNESNVFLNKEILLTFNKAVDSTTVAENTVTLTSVVGGDVVLCTLSLNPLDSTQLIVLPRGVLSENTQYQLTLVGSDQIIFDALKASDGEALTTTTSIYFTTGTSLYKIDTTVEKDASTLTLEGDLFLPTNVEALGYEFTINSVTPPNHTHGIATTLNGNNQLSFYFTKALATGQDYTTWADVEVYPLLDSTDYLASGTTLNAQTSGTATIPEYSINVSGQYLTVDFSGELPKNAGLYCRLTSDIISTSNDQYGGELEYISNTQLYPQIGGIHSVRRELNSIVKDIYDDYIGALIFKNTIALWERSGRKSEVLAAGWSPIKYVVCSTVLDIIEDKELEKFIIGGTRRQLGDLNVSVDSLIGRIAMKIARSQKCVDDSIDSIERGWFISTGTWKANMGTRIVDRLWYDVSNRYTQPQYKYYQPDEPSSNNAINRRAKSNNPFYL